MGRSTAWLRLPAAAIALLAAACAPDFEPLGLGSAEEAAIAEAAPPPAPEPPPTPEPAPPVMVGDVLGDGVVIAISKSSQQMHVFRNGELWGSSPVSTGKRGKETPSGVFAILQKRRHHRSNLYSNAPMPFMQRLTWDGIAIHAGRLPGYPASHGCIRLPREFAQSLFKLTGFTSTAVIVTDEPLETEQAALALASQTEARIPIAQSTLEREAAQEVLAQVKRTYLQGFAPSSMSREAAEREAAQQAFAYVTETYLSGFAPGPPPPPSAASGPSQPVPDGHELIQLAAASSQAEADAHWQRVVRAKPEMAKMSKTVTSAVVNGQQYYRLRASSPDARETCGSLHEAGFDCYAVN